MPNDVCCHGIVPVVGGPHRILLDEVSQSKSRWKQVSELDDVEHCDDGTMPKKSKIDAATIKVMDQ